MSRYPKLLRRSSLSRHAFAALLAISSAVLGSSCSYDWDVYDPRKGNGLSGSSSSSGDTSSSGTAGFGGGGMGGTGETGGMGGTGGTGGTGGMGGAGGSVMCTPDTTQACYTGPAGTLDIGLCKSGISVCQADGMSYSPCASDVKPTIEECATTTDDDCDAVKNDHCGSWITWGTGLGNKAIWDVAVDPSGNVLVTGYLTTSFKIATNDVISVGGVDIFVAKFDAAGTYLWSRVFGGLSDEQGLSIAVDSVGNSYVAGYFTGTMTMNGTTLTAVNAQDALVFKLDPSGMVLASKSFGGNGDQRIHAIAIDTADNVIATGSFTTEFTSNLGTMATKGMLDGFVMKLTSSLVTQWQKSFGDVSNDAGTALVLDSLGQVYLTGYFDTKANFGGSDITGVGGRDVFFAKLDSAGNHLLSKGFGVPGEQNGDAIGVDAAGNIYLVGDFKGSIDLGGGAVNSAGDYDAYLAKFTSDGTHSYTKTFGDVMSQEMRAMVVDKSGDVILALAQQGDVKYGDWLIKSKASNTFDIVVAKFEGASGNYIWARRFGNNSPQDPYALAVENLNNDIYVAGAYTGNIVVNDNKLAPTTMPNVKDPFLFRLQR